MHYRMDELVRNSSAVTLVSEDVQSSFEEYDEGLPASVITALLRSFMDEHRIRSSGKAGPGCQKREIMTVFHALEMPAISIRDYVERITKYFFCPANGFVLALHYLCKLIEGKSGLKVTEYTVHRLFVTAVMVTTKYLSDFFMSNSYYAKVAGVGLSELNKLEVEFLKAINFECFVSYKEYKEAQKRFINKVMSMEGTPLVIEAQAALREAGFQEYDACALQKAKVLVSLKCESEEALPTSPCSSIGSSPISSPVTDHPKNKGRFITSGSQMAVPPRRSSFGRTMCV